MGNISNNILSGSIRNNNTGSYSINNNNAFTSESIFNQVYGQEGYNYPQVNDVSKDGHFISSNGTHASWTTIDDYSTPVGPDFSTDYLLMWCETDQMHRKILIDDIVGAGASGAVSGNGGADLYVTIWQGTNVITANPYYTYALGGGDTPGHFRVGYMASGLPSVCGQSTFFTNGKTLFESVGNNTNVFIKTSTNTADESGRLILNRRRGVLGTESFPELNDTIGEIFFNAGAASSVYTTAPAASITVTASENFGTNFGSSLSIKTTKIGQTGLAERLLIDGDGTIKVTGQIYSTLPTLISPTANAITLNWNTGNGQAITLTGATGTVTVTLTNPKSGAVYLIKVTQSSTAARNITWPANVKWSGAVLPTITTTLNAIDTVALFYDGTNYYANISQNYG